MTTSLQRLASLGLDVSAAFEAVVNDIANRWQYPRLELRDATIALTASIASLLAHVDRIIVRVKSLVASLVEMGASFGSVRHFSSVR